MSLKAEQVFLAIQQSNNNLRDETCNYLRLEEDLAGQEQAELGLHLGQQDYNHPLHPGPGYSSQVI